MSDSSVRPGAEMSPELGYEMAIAQQLQQLAARYGCDVDSERTWLRAAGRREPEYLALGALMAWVRQIADRHASCQRAGCSLCMCIRPALAIVVAYDAMRREEGAP